MTDKITYSIILPIFNEQEMLSRLFKAIEFLLVKIDDTCEVILVNDGSSDATQMMLEAKAFADSRYKVINLSRNFGHQIAITAGMDAAQGDAIIVMDADLQDPPDVVLEMIERWKSGFDVVYARRTSREGESRFKRWTAHAFYRLLQKLTPVKIPEDVGDFRLVDRRVLDTFKTMRERDRYVRGMFSWIGFKQTSVEFVRPERAAGETKYGLWKMVRLALSGVLSFSEAPLRLALWLGFAVSVGALAFGAYVIILSFYGDELVRGWASTIAILSLLCGMNLIMTGIVGLYVGRIHEEVKNRPLYVVAPALSEKRGRDNIDSQPVATVNEMPEPVQHNGKS